MNLERISQQKKATVLVGLALAIIIGCEPDDSDAFPSTLPSTAEVFIDGFSAGLDFQAFGDSKVSAFQLDDEISYNKSDASMRFDVPSEGDPEGAYAGGIFFDNTGRDLSGYNVLSFWGRASQAATIQELGFGLHDTEVYRTSINNVPFSTAWTQYFILLPDASMLTEETGIFHFVDTPDDGGGYSFWIDDLKYENLGTIGQVRATIQNGADETIQAFVGQVLSPGALGLSFSLPNGAEQQVNASAAFFSLSSSSGAANIRLNETSNADEIAVVSEGEATITASLGEIDAEGSLTLEISEFDPAPLPTRDAANVISIFSDAYDNVPVDFYNGFYAPFQTTESADFTVDGDNVLNYINYNFVGMEFNQNVPTINGTDMTHLHMDIYIPDAFDPASTLRINLVDFGADASFGGGDDSSVALVLSASTSPALVQGAWISVDFDISALANKNNLGQIVLDAETNESPRPSSFFVDNIYLYNENGTTGGGGMPSDAAPAPTRPEMDVISIYSDAYTDVAGTDLNPDWGQGTVVTGEMINGNNTLLYSGLDFQGIQLGSSQDVSGMDFLHLDFWTDNSSSLNVYLISSGPVETPVALTVPTTGWTSIDIPLSQFSPVDLADVIQFKFDGNGDIYLDNIYFFTDSGGGSAPTSSAPVPPARDAADVISIFGETYSNISGIDYDPNWGQSGHMMVNTAYDPGDGNLALAYPNFNFQGTDFSGNAQDASAMEFLHVDIWVPTGTDRQVKVSPINTGTGAGEVLVEVPITPGSWNSVDLPIGDFTGMTWDQVIQMKFDGQFNGDGSGNTDPYDIYLDNIYFYRAASGGGSAPTSSAPVPPARDAADVISIFGETYSNISGIAYDPNWG
ncbi:MAG: hypothetical protein AB3N14_08510, partial [Flavobacteriaceae bacterium]